MKVVYVVDTVTELSNKINLLRSKFGDDIFYIVRADLVDLFKTYGYAVHAVYYKNLTKVMHNLLLSVKLSDVIIYYSSLKINNSLLVKFTNAIANKTKIVSLIPKYNLFERLCNSVYNCYVKSLFKIKDSMVSPKLQFIPSNILIELLETHLSNRIFEISPEISRVIQIEDAEISKTAKPKTQPLKLNLIALIAALIVTVGLLASIAYFKVSYLVILISSILYILDLILSIIFLSKAKFDQRFFK